MSGLRVIVCGGRNYQNYERVCEVLDGYDIRHLWHGNASGADKLAGAWGARKPGVSVHAVAAEWGKYGRKAGPIRNQVMLDRSPDLVIAFPGGSGTADMVRRSMAAGVDVLQVTDISKQAKESTS